MNLMKIYFLIFISLAYSSSVYACSCDFKPLKVISKDPKKANSAFTAVMKNGFLEIKKSWTPVTSLKIKTESSWPGHVTKCDLNLDEGQEYLILSTAKIKEPIPLNICSLLAIKLKDSQEILNKLSK